MDRFRGLLKRLAQLALLTILALIAIITVNVWRFESRQREVASAPVLDLPEEIVVERFARSTTFKTISEQNPARVNTEEFARFKSYLEDSFPRIHAELARFTGAEFGDDRNLSLLFRWNGISRDADAILLMAHYDVVPVEPEALSRWTHPPFEGYFDDEFVWGRGTLDVKNGALALMEAVEMLLGEGHRPAQTIYISLGHDEEVGGGHGNKPIAEWMRREGIRLEFVLDEGGCIFNDFQGLNQPLALIGIAEKGYVTTQLIVALEEGGHSSMPPKRTAIGILAEAVHRLHEHPFPRRLDGGASLTLDYIGPEFPLPTKVVMGNRWLFSPLIIRQIGATAAGDASLRTTIAPTMAAAGVKENVLPTKAELTVNFRILPGETINSTLNHIKNVIADDRVSIQTLETARNPSRMSSTDSAAFDLVHTTIKEIFPKVVVAPFVVVGGTDSSHYDDDSLSKDVYRFIPARLTSEDLRRIHGVDERISRQDYLNIVRFYVQLLKNAAAKSSSPR